MKKIGIIGGGIGGLTLAISLKKFGFECEVFEKKPEFTEVGAAISVWPNALKVYRELGIMKDILAQSGEFTEVYIRTAKGKVLSKTKPQYDLPAICMHRGDLHHVLLDHNSDTTLFQNHAFKDFSQLDNGQVEVTFENGIQKTFDAIVGADGIHSKVREKIIQDGEPIFRGYNIWRGVCKVDFDMGYGSETYGIGKRVGIVPIRDGKFGWWATMNEAFLQNDEPEGRKQKLMKHFGDWHDPIPALIDNTEEILKNSLTDRKPQRGWSKGNAVLLGDAAHPTTPNLGQGGCIAIEGAYLLAKCLSKYGISREAFQTYENLHFDRTREVIQTSLQLGQFGQLENPLGIFLRNFFFQIIPSQVNMKMIDKFFSHDVTLMKV